MVGLARGMARRWAGRVCGPGPVVVGVMSGVAATLVLIALDGIFAFGLARPDRVGFAGRAASVPPDVMTELAADVTRRLVLLHGLALAYLGLALLVVSVLWRRAGLTGRRAFAAMNLGLVGWLYVGGQLRLMAVHPYARDTAAWTHLWPMIATEWGAAGAGVVVVLGGAGLVLAFGRKLPAPRVSAAAAALVLFLPLLGPSSAGEGNGVPTVRSTLAALPRPPVIILGVDSLRADHVGQPSVTPNIDAFLRDAFVFTEARTAIARTHPSWVSMLSAQTPDHNGVRYNRVAPRFTQQLPILLPAHLAAQGYRTRFLTDDNMFSSLSSAHGFSRVDQPPAALRNYAVKPLLKLWLPSLLPARWAGLVIPELAANRAMYNTYDPDDFTREVARALDDEVAAAQPFLLAAHFCVAHYPGTQPAPHFRDYQPEPPIAGYFKASLVGLSSSQVTTAERQAQLVGLYRAGVASADRQLGGILESLRRSRLYDEAIIVLWSDHGESFTDGQGHPVLPSHGLYLDNGDQDLRVVMAIRVPGAAPGASSALVRTLDLPPTILEAAALPPLPGPRDGVSLASIMRGQPPPELEHYAETEIKWGAPQHPEERLYRFHLSQTYEYDDSEHDLVVRPRFHPQIVRGKHRMLRQGRFKVLYTPTPSGVWRLQDMESEELADVTARFPNELTRLRGQLEARIARDEASLPADDAADEDLVPVWWVWKTPYRRSASAILPSPEGAMEDDGAGP
jgi:arylsulfatase A-like enzyme